MEHPADRPGAVEGGPVIVWANWYRFRPSQRIVHPRVLSRCFLWVGQGSGTVSSGGRVLRLEQNTIARLPWGHGIDYRADARTPFLLGTLHVVPRHSRASGVIPEIDLLLGDPRRVAGIRSGDAEPEPGVTSSATGAGRRVAELGAFAIERFHSDPFDETVFRLLAELVLREGADWDAGRTSTSAPVAVDEMTAFVLENLGRPLRVEDVANAGHCSPTTAERLFRRWAESSVQTWIRRARMREAARLLRGSGLRVGEVAEAVGYADPLYFSRVFRATYGVPPSRFAAGDALP